MSVSAPAAASTLRIRDLRTHVAGRHGVVRAVDGVSLDLHPGTALALVGESGSGKSLLALSITRLLPPAARIVGGRVEYGGLDLARCTEAEMRPLRGRHLALVFQDSRASLNPYFTVGHQLRTVLGLARGPGGARPEAARELLGHVGIGDAGIRLGQYPHQLSGGLRQRVALALALAWEPRLLLADEPTTALDVTVQRQLLALLGRLRAERGLGLFFITHDLALAAETSERLAVMYAGRIVEAGPTGQVVSGPGHPYTRGLLASVASAAEPRRPLGTIPGAPPDPFRLPPGCPFASRCPEARAICHAEEPPRTALAPGHEVVCWLHT